MLKLSCPTCDKIVDAPEKLAGKKVQCPFCTGLMRVPALEPAADSSPSPTPAPTKPAQAKPTQTKPAPSGLTPLTPAKSVSAQPKQPAKSGSQAKPEPQPKPKPQEQPLPPPPAPALPPLEDEYGLAPLDDPKSPTTVATKPAAAPLQPKAPVAPAPTHGLTPLAPLNPLFDDRPAAGLAPAAPAAFSFTNAAPAQRPAAGLAPLGPASQPAYAPQPTPAPAYAPQSYPQQPALAYAGGPGMYAPAPAMAPSDSSPTIALALGIFSILFGLLSLITLCGPLIFTVVPIVGLVLGGVGFYMGRAHTAAAIVSGIGLAINGIFVLFKIALIVLFLLILFGLRNANPAMEDAAKSFAAESERQRQESQAILTQVVIEDIRAEYVPASSNVRYRLRVANRSVRTVGKIAIHAVWIRNGQEELCSVSYEYFAFPGGLPPGATGETTAEHVTLKDVTAGAQLRVKGVWAVQDPQGGFLGIGPGP